MLSSYESAIKFNCLRFAKNYFNETIFKPEKQDRADVQTKSGDNVDLKDIRNHLPNQTTKSELVYWLSSLVISSFLRTFQRLMYS